MAGDVGIVACGAAGGPASMMASRKSRIVYGVHGYGRLTPLL